jgi:hypothetical protein
MTANQLAKQVGYLNWRGVNAQYGSLAKRLCRALGVQTAGVHEDILATTIPPETGVANGELQLVMRPPVAEALKALRWVW